MTYPAEAITFEPPLPDLVRSCFQEAVMCHAAGCYRAAAAMVRRTLEVLCEDQGCSGSSLRARVKDLRTKVTISPPLYDVLKDLRQLGNDAVHVELKHFDAVNSESSNAGIEVVMEVMRATYAQQHIIDKLKRLRKRK